jgi:hypothetical protein
MGWSDVEHPKEVEASISRLMRSSSPKDSKSPKQVLEHYIEHPQTPGNPITPLTPKQRAHVMAEVEGVSPKKYGYSKEPSVLANPKVADALEDILDKSGLTDKKMAKRMKEIIFNGKGAGKDNVAHNAIRTVWQLKGKFAPEKIDVLHRSDLENLKDDQLNRIIESGFNELRILQIKRGETSKETDASDNRP